jgi:hypothetical protein
MQDWLFANIGFDTNVKVWFIDFIGQNGKLLSRIFGPEVVVVGGNAKQIEWYDEGEGPFYHIRERIYPDGLISIRQEASDDPVHMPGKITITYKEITEEHDDGVPTIPDTWETVRYAYDVKSSRGFAEFLDADGKLLCKITDRWILVEGLTRRTIGEFPNIRLEAKRQDVSRVVLTDTILVLSR